MTTRLTVVGRHLYPDDGTGAVQVEQDGTSTDAAFAYGTAAVRDTGTSGAMVPLLSAANTWSLTQTFILAPSVPGLIGTVQPLTGAGAVNLTTMTTAWTTTAADAGTLANGSNGQIKTIVMVAHGGDGTLTPANLAGGTTITFNAVGDSVLLQFLSTDWFVISNNGCVVA